MNIFLYAFSFNKSRDTNFFVMDPYKSSVVPITIYVVYHKLTKQFEFLHSRIQRFQLQVLFLTRGGFLLDCPTPTWILDLLWMAEEEKQKETKKTFFLEPWLQLLGGPLINSLSLV